MIYRVKFGNQTILCQEKVEFIRVGRSQLGLIEEKHLGEG
jgi:hypothetical protein